MANLIYGLPTWLLGVLTVGIAAVLSALGLVVVHRLVPTDRRRPQNDIAGYISNIAAFVYAVLLAFLAVAVWQDYQKAAWAVQLEANAASDVYRQASGYPDGLRQRIRDGIRAYLDIVIVEEWPVQHRGLISDAAWRPLVALHRDLVTFDPTTVREQVLHTEQLEDMDRLMDQRRIRIHASRAGLHGVTWVVMLVGSAMVVAFSFFMGSSNFRAHLAMTMILGASIGLVIFLILAIDRPFRGGVAIEPDALVRVRDNLRHLGGD